MKPGLPMTLLPFVRDARGRCHSCAHQRTFELPVSGPVFYCRAFGSEYRQAERDAVRNCPRWAPFRPTDEPGRARRREQNPMLARVIDAEDHLFWQLAVRLAEHGVDLKSVLVLAQPSLGAERDLGWVDTLHERFGQEAGRMDQVATLEEIVCELRALRYPQVCDVLASLVEAAVRDENASGAG